MKTIEGKIIAITGASSGIGKTLAFALAAEGAKVVLGARRATELKKITTEINGKKHGNAIFIKTDVTNKAEVADLVALAMENYGKLDVIINNAGIAKIGKMDDLDIEGWDKMIDVNIKGFLYGMAAAIPVFKSQKSGHIVNIISTAGLKIVPTQGVYAGTKNAVRTISEAFRQESNGTIRITGISPGYIKTDFAIKSVATQEMKSAAQQAVHDMAIDPGAGGRSVIYAISEPKDVEIGDIVIRPAKQN